MSLAEAVERGSKESRKERRRRRNQPDIRRVGDGWRKWIGRCGHGVAGGVGATGLAEKYTTAGGGIAGVGADRRQDRVSEMQGSKRGCRTRNETG